MVVNTKYKIPSSLDLYRITTGKDDWQSKIPIDKWSYLFGIGKVFGDVSGLVVFNDDQRYRLRASFFYIFTVVYALLTIYTFYFHLNRGDLEYFLSATCLLTGPVLAVSSEYLK